MTKNTIPPDLQKWIDAKKRCRLSQTHICMAMELGLNPRKLSGLIPNPKQQWKAPLPEFIEDIYEKRFGRTRPKSVQSFQQMSDARTKKKVEQKKAKVSQLPAPQNQSDTSASNIPDDPSQPH